MTVKFKHGDVRSVPHSPSSAVVKGQVVVAGEIPFIAHNAIAANASDGVVAAFGGVYEATGDGTPDSGGALVYWDDTADKVTTNAASGANKQIGYTLPDQGASNDGDPVRFVHMPG